MVEKKTEKIDSDYDDYEVPKAIDAPLLSWEVIFQKIYFEYNNAGTRRNKSRIFALYFFNFINLSLMLLSLIMAVAMLCDDYTYYFAWVIELFTFRTETTRNLVFIFCEGFFLALATVVGLLISIAFYTLIERKIMAAMHRRRGPNVVGFLGLLQPFADGFKLILKEIIIPTSSNIFLFLWAPIFMFILSLLLWAVIPWTRSIIYFDYKYSLLFIIAISSFNVYGIILSGWASNSKYAFLGSLRSTAQMISYEIALSFILVFFVLLTSSFNLQQIIVFQEYLGCWLILPFWPLAIIFFCSMLAETNRAPFDLPEAEAELVSGYNTEYSSIAFALFFLAEYSNMLFMSAFFSILFLGGWVDFVFIKSIPNIISLFCEELVLPIKIVLIAFIFVWVRAAVPRYRYDQLMAIGWKIFLPFTLGFLFFFLFFFYFFNGFLIAIF